MSDKLFFIIAFAIIIEALIEYVKGFVQSVQTKEWRTIIIQISSLIIGIIVCCLAKVNIFDILGFDVHYMVGCVITGIFASRGSNYIHDIMKKIQSVKGE